ncbi:phospholipase D-like domain-containing protein [Pandoraea bronchicola]|uniref:Phospholipase n=1 Tax=Pandoraea bronchicola TaxID=2508287 RepID=A0A5E5BW45_9BURK|nr:phospholipase D-like domain-containing protein [Pandoraea bronchicola]VVE90039.1 phospholipase [Pandoraea bronchicola]
MRHTFAALALALSGVAPLCAAPAPVTVPGFELVHTAPTGAGADSDDLRDSATVWADMFDHAKTSIDFGQFYVSGEPGSRMDTVLEHLEAAGRRGVKIRFLMEAKGERMSDEATLSRVRSIPNLEFRMLDFSKVGGGIIHAKYFVVDRREGFVGSQNFDWRALEHIDETGVRVSEPKIVAQMQAIFEQDWQTQAALASGAQPTLLNRDVAPADIAQTSFLVASPNAFNPPGVGDSQSALPALLGQAKHSVQIQLMDYAPLSFGAPGKRPYYGVIDTALRTAAARGVKVQMLVSNWNLKRPDVAYLKSLAVVPNVELRVVTVPPASKGFIPYARVVHSKTMVIDGELAWVGTSNWTGGYFDNSRNLEVVMRDAKMAQRVAQLQRTWWTSPYTAPIDVSRDYPVPHPGTP